MQDSLKLADLLAQLTKLVGRVVTPIPLAEFREKILNLYATKKKTTRLRMAQALREISELAGSEALSTDITTGLIDRFGTRDGRASTTNGLLRSLRTALNLGVDKGWVSPSAYADATWVVEDLDPPRKRHHSRDDIAKVLEHLRSRSESWTGGRLYALGAVYAFTGLRKNEALRLKVADLDVGHGLLMVRPNGRKLKTKASAAPVPCPAVLLRILVSWAARCGSEWLFPCVRKKDTPWMHGAAGKRPTDRLKAAGLEVGVEGFTPLSLRHSLATHLAGWWGLKDKQIQLILRHTSTRTQAHYVHPDFINLRRSVRGFTFDASHDHERPNRSKGRPKARRLKVRLHVESRPGSSRPILRPEGLPSRLPGGVTDPLTSGEPQWHRRNQESVLHAQNQKPRRRGLAALR